MKKNVFFQFSSVAQSRPTLFPHLFPVKWWDQRPWSLFSEALLCVVVAVCVCCVGKGSQRSGPYSSYSCSKCTLNSGIFVFKCNLTTFETEQSKWTRSRLLSVPYQQHISKLFIAIGLFYEFLFFMPCQSGNIINLLKLKSYWWVQLVSVVKPVLWRHLILILNFTSFGCWCSNVFRALALLLKPV